MPKSRHASRAEMPVPGTAGFGSFSCRFTGVTVSEENRTRTLLVVDGSSYLYRAFHALPELKSPRGEPTGAIYGVAGMLRRLAADHKADALACVFDAPGPTFREREYAAYKANRAPMPEPLAAQIAPLQELVAALGWPVLSVEGVEADDVIATLVEEARRRGWRAIVSTSDKDLAQLVDERVTLVNTMSNETLDAAAVRQKFGVPPERIPDLLALTGDAVDNVPGVEKVGPKTAAKWLAQYGSLEALLGHAADIGGVAGENLRKALDWLPQARRLLTVRRDLALAVSLADLAPRAPDRARLRTLFERFGFRSWLRELDAAEGAAGAPPASASALRAERTEAAAAPRRRYVAILDEHELERALAALDAAPLAGLDTETTALEPIAARLVGLSFAAGDTAWYLPLAHDYPGAPAQLALEPALARLKPWLESERHAKVCQNAKFDAHVLANHGVRLAGLAHDTLLESYVYESHERHDMDSLAARHLGWKTITYDEVTGRGAARIPFSGVDIARATEYAAEDADFALALHGVLYPKIAAEAGLKRVYEEIEMPLVPVLVRMERTGVLLDCARLAAQSEELGRALLALERRAHELAGCPFNLNSPKQIQEILFVREKLPVKKRTPSGQPSTDEDVLAELALDYPLPKALLEYRALAKLKSTYTDKLPKMVDPRTGRVHTTYSQTTAVTGRLASNDPNLQNIPVRTPEGRRIREAFIAPPGAKLVSADYSQIELRIMAHLSGDEGLRHAFARGHDVHRATAAEVFGVPLERVSEEERRAAKVINFGLIYGMSSYGLAQTLGVERATAQAYMDAYFARYPGVKRFMDATRERARERGYVETAFGRRLWLPEIGSRTPARRQAAERAAINAPMQGTAADLIKLAMIALQRWIDAERLGARLILQVHDELVLEVPEPEVALVKEGVRELMQGVAKLEVPLVVDVGCGDNWEEAH
jgi:DNA polymerase-1